MEFSPSREISYVNGVKSRLERQSHTRHSRVLYGSAIFFFFRALQLMDTTLDNQRPFLQAFAVTVAATTSRYLPQHAAHDGDSDRLVDDGMKT